MLRGIFCLLILAAGFEAGKVVFAQADRRVEAIKKLIQKTDEDIARSEQEPEYSNIYLTELSVNKNNGSYPAVGIYRPVVKFYYTYGDREREPFPTRILKIIVSIDRSDTHEQAEYTFNEAEKLVFFLERKGGIERRIYFATETPIRFEQDGRVITPTIKSRAAMVPAILLEKTNLVAIFRRSLGL